MVNQTIESKLPYSILRCNTHEDWLRARAEGIGSSEAGIVCCVSPFDTPVQLWNRKVNPVNVVEKEKKCMTAGHEFEPDVAHKFAVKTGAIIDPSTEGDWIAVSKAKPHLRVSPDRLFYLPDTPAEKQTYDNAYLLECKTTSHDCSESVPLYWEYQVQYQMHVLGIRRAVIAWISTYGGLSFGYKELAYNRVFAESIAERIDRFWFDNVLKKVPPQLVMNGDDCNVLWKKAAPGADGKGVTVRADKNIIDLVAEYGRLYPRYKAEDERIKEIKTSIQCYMKDATTLLGDGQTVLAKWSNIKVSPKFDEAHFAAENAELYNRYMTPPGTARRFSFK